MIHFVKGEKLSKDFYIEIVQPLISKNFPKLNYSAGLIGRGSEVLGLDTIVSTDHDWGPRLIIFLKDEDYNKYSNRLNELFRKNLPKEFKGFATNFTNEKHLWSPRLPMKINSGEVNHKIDIYAIRDYILKYLDYDIDKSISYEDWLTFPEQKLLTIKESKLFRDDLNFKKIINKFEYYPKDIWLYLLASQWQRIGHYESFVRRCAEAGDELGSRINVNLIVEDLVKLSFLMEKRYIPYLKWQGTLFAKLELSKQLLPLFLKILSATNIREREYNLVKAYSVIAKKHNELKITKPLRTTPVKYFNRNYYVLQARDFASEIQKSIKDSKIKNLQLLGSINQFTEVVDLVKDTKEYIYLIK